MKQRLANILEERKTSPETYKRDGWQYFEEFLPMIEDALQISEALAHQAIVVEKEPPKKVEKVSEDELAKRAQRLESIQKSADRVKKAKKK